MIETFATENDDAVRLKRARMRSWRRGMREMDLILGGFIDLHGASLTGDRMDAFEAILQRRDQDLYRLVSGQVEEAGEPLTPCEASLISEIRANWRSFTENSP